jgi:hypothetical protein
MNTITINNKEYQSPASYNELPFKHFIELQKIANDETIGNYRKCVERVSIVTGADVDEIKYHTTPLQLVEINKTLEFLYEVTDFENAEFITDFKDADGNIYFINNLDITADFVSYEDIIMSFQQSEYDGYAFQLAMLCRKNSESLEDIQTNGDLLKTRVEVMKNLPTDLVFRVCSFFTKREESTQRFTELSTSLQLMREQLLTHIKNDLTEYTDGTKPLSSLQVASLKLIKCSL